MICDWGMTNCSFQHISQAAFFPRYIVQTFIVIMQGCPKSIFYWVSNELELLAAHILSEEIILKFLFCIYFVIYGDECWQLMHSCCIENNTVNSSHLIHTVIKSSSSSICHFKFLIFNQMHLGSNCESWKLLNNSSWTQNMRNSISPQ